MLLLSNQIDILIVGGSDNDININAKVPWPAKLNYLSLHYDHDSHVHNHCPHYDQALP